MSNSGKRVAVPVEPAGLDDDAAHGRAVAAQELRGGVDDDVGAPLERPVQVRGGEGRVDDERHAGGVRDLGEALDVGDLAGRVRDRLGEDELGPVGDRGGVVGRVGARDERRLDAEAPQRDVQLGDRAAVQAGGGDDVVAGAAQRGEQ